MKREHNFDYGESITLDIRLRWELPRNEKGIKQKQFHITFKCYLEGILTKLHTFINLLHNTYGKKTHVSLIPFCKTITPLWVYGTQALETEIWKRKKKRINAIKLLWQFPLQKSCGTYVP